MSTARCQVSPEAQQRLQHYDQLVLEGERQQQALNAEQQAQKRSETQLFPADADEGEVNDNRGRPSKEKTYEKTYTLPFAKKAGRKKKSSAPTARSAMSEPLKSHTLRADSEASFSEDGSCMSLDSRHPFDYIDRRSAQQQSAITEGRKAYDKLAYAYERALAEHDHQKNINLKMAVKLDEKLREVEGQSKEIQDLKRQEGDYVAAQEVSETKIRDLTNETMRLENEKANLKTRIEICEKSLEEAKSHVKEQSGTLAAQSAAIASLEAKLQGLNDRLDDRNRELDALRKKHDELEHTKRKAESEFSTKHALQRQETSNLREKLASITEEKRQMADHNEQLRRETTVRSDELLHLQKTLESEKSTFNAASEEMQNLRTDLSEAQTTITALKSANVEVEKRAETAEDQAHNLATENGKLKGEVKDIRNQVAKRNEANGKLLSENSELKVEISSLKTRVDHLTTSLDGAEAKNKALSEENSQLNQTNGQVCASNEGLNDNLVRASKALEECNEKINELTLKNASLAKDLDAKTTSGNDLRERYVILKKEKKEHAEGRRSAEQACRQRDEQLKDCQIRHKDQEEELRRLRKLLEEEKQRSTEMSRRNNELHKEVDELDANLAKKNRQLEHFTKLYKKERDESDELLKENHNLKARIKKMDGDFQDKLIKIEKSKVKAKEQNRKLKRQHSTRPIETVIEQRLSEDRKEIDRQSRRISALTQVLNKNNLTLPMANPIPSPLQLSSHESTPEMGSEPADFSGSAADLNELNAEERTYMQ